MCFIIHRATNIQYYDTHSMYTLRILNIIRPHHISSDHPHTTPLCRVSFSSLIFLCQCGEGRCYGARVLRCYGVTEWRCVVKSHLLSWERREREEAGSGCESYCVGVLRPTKYKTDWVRPHSAPASDQSQQSRSNRGGYKENIVWYHYWYYDLRYTLHYTRHYTPPSCC